MLNNVRISHRQSWINKRSIRLVAASVCLLLMLLLTLLGILALQALASPLLFASRPLMHVNGTVQSVKLGQSFVLKTRDGKPLQLLCGEQCYVSFPHLERHLNEHAQTDVYCFFDQQDRRTHVFYAD